MKKLTAGIFAGILGMVSMGAADANVASTGWVNQQLGTKADTSVVTALDTVVQTLKGAVYDSTTQQPISIEDLRDALEGDIEALEGKFVDADKNPIDLSALQAGLEAIEKDVEDIEKLIGEEAQLPLEATTVIEALNKINNKTASNADFTQLKETVGGTDGNGGLVGDVAALKTNVGTTPVSDQISGALTTYYTSTITPAIDAAKLKNAGDATHAFYTDADGKAITITKVAEAAKADSATNADYATSAGTATTATSATTATTAGTADLAKGYVEGEAIDLALKSKQAQLQAAGAAGKPVYIGSDGQPVAMDQVLDAAHADSADTATNADYATSAGTATTATTATTAAGYTTDGAIAAGLASKVSIPSLTASDAAFGKYVLTADKTAEGATYYWEQIERATNAAGEEQF